ncbi:hypothetical protein HDU96_001227 [Phlyctochytrium bullatum]|nr:hypothetical protein HDU96_001227 [Phlyctochytrium bullatum]
MEALTIALLRCGSFFAQENILNLGLACKGLLDPSLALLYRHPDFDTLFRSSIDTFKLFLDALPQNGHLVVVLNVNGLTAMAFEESNFETAWLKSVNFYCTNLQELRCRECSILSDGSISNGMKAFRCLNALDISMTQNLSMAAACRLLALCPNLTHLTMEDKSGLSDEYFKKAISCTPKLTALKLRECNISDASVELLAQLRQSKLERLTLSLCRRITDHSIRALSHHCPTLHHLKLNGCTKLTLPTITLLSHLPLTRLDLRGCRSLHDMPFPLLETFLTSLAPTLGDLALSYRTIDRHRTVKFDLEPIFKRLRGLQRLTFDDIDEKTPNNIIYNIAAYWVPSLRVVRLYRVAYSTDVFANLYTTVETHALCVDEAFVRRFNDLFGRRCRMFLQLVHD